MKARSNRLMNRCVLGLCIAFVFSGCATPYSTVIKNYQDATVSCDSMHEFNFESIRIGDSKSFDLDENSPAYVFDTGKSYYKAFVLPQSSCPFQISIRSYMLGDHIDSAYIFFPQALTLNRNHEVVRSTDPLIFQFKKAGFIETLIQTGGLMYKIEGQISFTEKNKTEKYLVILTTNELLEAKTSTSTWRTVPIIFPGIVGAIPIGKYEVLVPHSPTGRISITAQIDYPDS
jgi:maltose operon protein